jgi:hypothetical protein
MDIENISRQRYQQGDKVKTCMRNANTVLETSMVEGKALWVNRSMR